MQFKSMSRMALLVGAFIFSHSLYSQVISVDHQWMKLLRYNKTLFGTYLSEADGKDYFLHPDGKRNPQAELDLFIKTLKNDSSDEAQAAFCRFPARVRWLESKGLKFSSVLKCQKLQEFRERLSAQSIAVVFSSYYLDNPSSSFGHTFIRMGKNKKDSSDSTATELLDTGINYGAVTGDAGPVVYTLGGLTGLFPGTFNAIPYYYKVREYNDFESRDLWSYELDFNQEEIDFVVDHIWELGHTFFDYYFLTENCSYHVLTILEAAKPSVNLTRYLSSLYVIPSDTLKTLDKEGLISDVKFRPSPSTVFKYHLDQLNQDEKARLSSLVKNPESILDIKNDRQVLMMDSALSFVDFKYAKEIIKENPEAKAIKQPLLSQRARLAKKSPEYNFEKKFNEAPHLGHGSNRLGVSFLSQENKNFSELEWRFAFHDFLDYDLAYPPHMKLEVMKLIFRADEFQNVKLRELSVLDVVSIGDYNQYSQSPSWKVKMGQSTTFYEGEELTTAGLSLGYGIAKSFRKLTPFILSHLELGSILEGSQQAKVGFGFDYGVLVDFNSHLKFLTQFQHRFDRYQDENILSELRYSQRERGLGAFYREWRDLNQSEIGLKLFIYL